MAEIIWSKKAKGDLQAIYNFISRDSVFYADRFIYRLVDLIEALEEFPLSGRIVPEIDHPSVREIIYGNYRIFYRLGKANAVYILRIHHSARLIR